MVRTIESINDYYAFWDCPQYLPSAQFGMGMARTILPDITELLEKIGKTSLSLTVGSHDSPQNQIYCRLNLIKQDGALPYQMTIEDVTDSSAVSALATVYLLKKDGAEDLATRFLAGISLALLK